MNANAMLEQFAKGAAKEAPQYTEIRREDVEGHPVHSIECMTDFCERSAKVHADHIPGIVLNLMEERV